MKTEELAWTRYRIRTVNLPSNPPRDANLTQ